MALDPASRSILYFAYHRARAPNDGLGPSRYTRRMSLSVEKTPATSEASSGLGQGIQALSLQEAV